MSSLRYWHNVAMRPVDLSGVGIGESPEAIYRCVLRHPGSGISEIAATLDLAVPEVRRGLTLLEEKGLISRSASKRVRFHAAPPTLAIEALILRQQEQLQRARVRASELSKELSDIADPVAIWDLVEVVSGQDAVIQRILQVQRSAQREVLVFDRPPYATDDATANSSEVEHLQRGVRARVVYDRSALEIPGQLEEIRGLAAQGEEARVAEDVPMKMLIADGRVGLVPLRLSDESAGIVLIHASALLDALTALFEAFWRMASPIQLANGSGRRADEDLLVTLLAAGLTDAAMASHLRVSRRTVQRRVRALMDRHGAQSRAQLLLRVSTQQRLTPNGS